MGATNNQIINILSIFSSVKNVCEFRFPAHDFNDIVKHSLVIFINILYFELVFIVLQFEF